MHYDAAAGGYMATFDTTGLAAGVYTVYLGSDDGKSLRYEIVLTQ
jgi:hypothetical protein